MSINEAYQQVQNRITDWNSKALKSNTIGLILSPFSFEFFFLFILHFLHVLLKLTRNVNVSRMAGEGHQIHRQRSQSLAWPLSRSADWTEELEKRLRRRDDDGGGSGSGDYLMGYRGGGSQPICAMRRSSCGHISSCGFQDIFTGQHRSFSILYESFLVNKKKKL